MDIRTFWKRKVLLVLVIAFIAEALHRLNTAKEPDPSNDPFKVYVDLDKIKKRGKLIALTNNSSTGYFVYKGEPMGYEYELLNFFAKHLGVELDIIITRDMNTILDQLNEGVADIAAANLTVTEDRLEYVNFSQHFLVTRQVLVQRKPTGWKEMPANLLGKKLIRDPSDLIGEKVHIRKNSAFYSRLSNLSDEAGGKIEIIEAPGDYDTETLISMVASGEIDYTIADEHIARVNKTYYPDIDIETSVSFSQKISWAVRKNSTELLQELNRWIGWIKNNRKYHSIYNKYFEDRKGLAHRSESKYFSERGGKISPYDDIIRKNSVLIGWDWRLIAAQICEESQFDTSARSWAGAFGIMQLMPHTAALFGADSTASPAEQIKAGIKYIAWIDNHWKQYIADSTERIKFVLASYNVGLGHVIDARSLAFKYGADPNIWDENVATFLLQKSKAKYYTDPVVRHGYCRGEEPFCFVKEILVRYEHYKNVIN